MTDNSYDPYADVVTPVTDKEAARGYLRRYGEDSARYNANYDAIMKRRQDAISQVRSSIDDTIAEMRAKQSGAGAGQVNLPLLALGAGLLSPEPGGRVGNFGSELSRGAAAMGATIHKQRMGDADFLKGIADLQRASGMLGDAPMKDEATNEMRKAMQADALRGRLETALTRAQYSSAGGADPALVKEWRAFVASAAPGTEESQWTLQQYQEYKSRLGADRNTPSLLREMDAVNKDRKEKGQPAYTLEEWQRVKAGAGALGREVGKSRGEAQQALPGQEMSLDMMINTLGQIAEHPGKKNAFGIVGQLPDYPGGPTDQFNKLREQFDSQAFLMQFDKLRGAGQITEVEGKKATSALSIIGTTRSAEQFNDAVKYLRGLIERGRGVMRQKAGEAPKPPMEGARQGRDGKWYVEKDGQLFEVRQ